MTNTCLTQLTSTDDDDLVLRKVMTKNPFRQLDRDAANRGCAAADAGLGADFLDGLERLLKYPIQHWASEVRRPSRFIRGLHLAGNLCLTQHHRIEAAGDAKEMAHRFTLFNDVTMQTKVMLTASHRLQERIRWARFISRHSIYFHSITGGEQNDFAEFALDLQTACLFSEVRGCDREPFTYLNGRRSVAHAGNEKLHGIFLGYNCARSLGSSVSECRMSEATCARTCVKA